MVFRKMPINYHLDELHRHEGYAVHLVDVVDLRDGGVGDAARRAGLEQETSPPIGVGGVWQETVVTTEGELAGTETVTKSLTGIDASGRARPRTLADSPAV